MEMIQEPLHVGAAQRISSLWGLVPNRWQTNSGSCRLWQDIGPWRYIRFEGSHRSVTLKGNDQYPRVFGLEILNSKSILFERICGNPSADMRHVCLYRDGLEAPIDSGLGNVRISYLTARQGNTLYAKYSYGKADGWRYHAFAYNFDNGFVTKLGCPAVVGVSSSGELATLPEVTDVKNGDFNTHWNNRVVLSTSVAGPET